MRQYLDDKRIRYLLIAVLVVVLVLGLLNIISTAFSLLVPLAIAAGIAFAFYKLVIEGRDTAEVMEDEIAASAGAVQEGSIDAHASDDDAIDEDEDEAAARQRLSALERAQSAYFDTASPAEEILDQIKSRKRRLAGDDDS